MPNLRNQPPSSAIDPLTTEIERRLLESAGEVFAERGFQHATVRQICQRAGANVAAVNYHFGDKEALYRAVIRYAHICAHSANPTIQLPNCPPEERLRVFIQGFLRRLLDPGRPSWHGRLMAREINEPTGALEEVVENEIRPQMEMIRQVIADIAGPVPPESLARCVASIIGQMLHYHFANPVMQRLNPTFADLRNHVDDLANHVYQFSLAGIRAVAEVHRHTDRK
jgi:TetR/AcrR family transcriptional regulator, regulator of cefoperazone and chloramphenicol sensitivity